MTLKIIYILGKMDLQGLFQVILTSFNVLKYIGGYKSGQMTMNVHIFRTKEVDENSASKKYSVAAMNALVFAGFEPCFLGAPFYKKNSSCSLCANVHNHLGKCLEHDVVTWLSDK
jgi:hypothetical protein